MPRPKPPEPLTPRHIRMTDKQWATLQAWGGADKLRRYLDMMQAVKNGPT